MQASEILGNLYESCSRHPNLPNSIYIMPRILMICNSIIGHGRTSGSSIRAERFRREFTKMGYQVQVVQPFIRRRIHPMVNFIINLIMSIPYLTVKVDIVYSISDLLPDAVFGVLYKLLHPRVTFICGCHSLVQSHIKGRTRLHSLYSYWSQRTIHLLLKYTCNRLLVSNNYDNGILTNRGHKVVTIYAAPNF